jgi:hypothetical protein
VGVVADHGMNDKSKRRWRAQRRVSARGAERALRRWRGARHLPDHRPVRAPSRGAGLVRARLCAQGLGPRGADGREPGAAWRGSRARGPAAAAPLRAAAGSGGRFRRAGRCRHGESAPPAPSTI